MSDNTQSSSSKPVNNKVSINLNNIVELFLKTVLYIALTPVVISIGCILLFIILLACWVGLAVLQSYMGLPVNDFFD